MYTVSFFGGTVFIQYRNSWLKVPLSIMDRSALLSSIQRLQLRKETLLLELESLDLDLQSQQAQYSRLVNDDVAVYKLPNELLTTIFMMCANTSTKQWPTAFTRSLPFQVVASHVSHRWRDITLGTPLLWNTFIVRIMKRLNGPHMVSRLEAHLERSNSCFLDIALDFRVSDDLAVYCRLLAKHSQRWRRLSILTTFEEINHLREMLHGVEVPMLEHLSLILGRSNTFSPRQQFTSVTPAILAACPPCLSFVRLAGQALGNLHPPTSSITTLHLDGWTRHFITHDQLKVVLEGAPLLINLSLNQLHLNHPRDPFDIADPTTLPFLRALRICGPCSPVSRFMSLLCMPQLESMTLDRLETFDSQVMRTVRSLNLDCCRFNEQEFSKLIHSFPSISDLSIDESLPEILYALLPGTNNIPVSTEGGTTPSQSPPLAWPQLQTIAIRDLQSLDVPNFCKIVFHRQEGSDEGSSPLRRILLDRRSRTVLRAKQRLEWLQEKFIVENADIPAPWPMGLQYEDAQDLLE